MANDRAIRFARAALWALLAVWACGLGLACGEGSDPPAAEPEEDPDFPTLAFDTPEDVILADAPIPLGDTGLTLTPPADWRRFTLEEMTAVLAGIEAAEIPEPQTTDEAPAGPVIEPLLVMTDLEENLFLLANLLPTRAGTGPADILPLLERVDVPDQFRARFSHNGLRFGQTLDLLPGTEPGMVRREFQLFVAAPTGRIVHLIILLSEQRQNSPGEPLNPNLKDATIAAAIIASVSSRAGE